MNGPRTAGKNVARWSGRSSNAFRRLLLVLTLLTRFWTLSGAAPGEFRLGEQTWKRYSKGSVTLAPDGLFTIVDNDEKNGAGIFTALPAQAGRRLNFSGEFKALNGDVPELFIQARFMPGKKIVQQKFALKQGDGFRRIEFIIPPPPKGSKEVWIYVYVHPGRSAFLLRGMTLGSAENTAFDRARLKARPKEMLLSPETLLVLPGDGSADDCAALLCRSAKIPFKVVKGALPQEPYSGAILVGTRDNNPLIAELYDRYHLIADRYYPGPGGWQVRPIFRPYGDGRDFLLVSGSDAAGTAAAAKRLAAKLETLPVRQERMTLPFFWDVRISPQYVLPQVVAKAHTFDESEGYGTRFFGWNVLARHMALFYATGDERYARRFLELAFPRTPEDRKVLTDDGGTFKLPDDPLAGPYHYNSVMADLYWAMIEDHPVFSDEERAHVAEAMFRQFLFWRDTSNGCGIYNTTSPTAQIGNRHQQWGALSLYAAARYLDKVMPAPEFKHALKAAENFFSSIRQYRFVEGEGGNLTWYPSGIEPVPFFMLLAGWKEFAPKSALGDLYRSLETLCGNRHGERVRNYVPLSFLRRTAYLLDDNAPLALEKSLEEHFRTGTFRLGQSFAPPPEGYRTSTPTRAGAWNFIRPSPAERKTWRTSFQDPEQGFHIASYRADDDWGDLIIVDGHLDRILRQPLHAMAIFTLVLDRLPLLAGYRSQLWARQDGLSFSSMPDSARCDCAMGLADAAGFASTLPAHHELVWQRTLLKTGAVAVIADTLTQQSARAGKYSIDTVWELAPELAESLLPDGRVRLVSTDLKANSRYCFEALRCRYAATPEGGTVVRLGGGVPALLFKAQGAGEKLTVDFALPEDFSGEARLRMYAFRDRGVFSAAIDGTVLREDLAHFATDAGAVYFDLGQVRLAKGRHQLTLETTAPSQDGGWSIAFSALALQDGGAAPREGALLFSDPAQVRLDANKPSLADRLSGKAAVFTSQVSLKPGARRSFFTLAAARPAGELFCRRLNDHAALLKLPERAVAVQGHDAALGIAGQLVLLSDKELCGMRLTRARRFLTADRPVDLRWEFASGKLEVAGEAGTTVTAAGKALTLPAGGRAVWELKAPPPLLEELRRTLAALPWEAPPRSDPPVRADAPLQKPRDQCRLDGYPTDLIAVGDALAAAAGKTVQLLTPELKTLRTFSADSTVGRIAYAPHSGLLLAGCEDGKVIAFDAKDGTRRWEHRSEEAAGLRETGAHWYLKSTFPGIYGLAAGKFPGEEENILVGSASTFELLAADGKLLRREKILWGPVRHFALFPIDGTMRAAMCQLYPGGDYLTLFDPAFRMKTGYNLPPPGCLYSPSWAGINRTGITAVDLDRDGKLKIVSGLNGVWNRIIVWTADGKPVREVSFGPGDSLKVPKYGRERAEKRFLADVLTISAAEGNLIAAATFEALILFDRELRRLWSVPLPGEPGVAAAWPTGIAVGLKDGTLLFFDLKGRATGRFRGDGAWCVMHTANGRLYAATDRGTLYTFTLIPSQQREKLAP